MGVLWPSYSVKIKKNNLKNERAHSVSIDFHYPATYSFVSLGIFDNESRDKTFSLLNCASSKSCISMKQNYLSNLQAIMAFNREVEFNNNYKQTCNFTNFRLFVPQTVINVKIFRKPKHTLQKRASERSIHK